MQLDDEKLKEICNNIINKFILIMEESTIHMNDVNFAFVQAKIIIFLLHKFISCLISSYGYEAATELYELIECHCKMLLKKPTKH